MYAMNEKDIKQVEDYLQAILFKHRCGVQLTPESYWKLYEMLPDANYLDTRAGYKKLRIGVPENMEGIPAAAVETRRVFERNGERIPISEATNEEKQQMLGGSLKIKTIQTEIPVDLFELRETTYPQQEYSNFYQNTRPATSPVFLCHQMEVLLRSVGIDVSSKDFGDIPVDGYYDVDLNHVYINQSFLPEDKVHTYCRVYAEGLNEILTTSHSAVAQLEVHGMYAALCNTFELPYTDEAMQALTATFETAEKTPPFNSSESVTRVWQKLQLTDNQIDATRPLLLAQPMQQEHQFMPTQEEIINSFMKDL